MDALDAAMLRALLRNRQVLWGGWDPRLGIAELADILGVDRTTVWARFKAWREQGFLLRQEVLPNPWLFGAGLAGGDIRVEDPRDKEAVLDRLRLVDGVVGGLDQVGPYVLVMYGVESPAGLERCRQLLATLPGIAGAGTCIPFAAPASAIAPSATDWRILAALRAHPDAALHEVAAAADVSGRTFRRRYAELLEGNAIWSFPLFDFANYKGAVMARFVCILDGPASLAAFMNEVRRELACQVWVAGMDVQPPGAPRRVAFADVFCHLESAAASEPVQQWLLDRGPVVEVETFFPKRWFVVDGWFDQRIAAVAEKASGQA